MDRKKSQAVASVSAGGEVAGWLALVARVLAGAVLAWAGALKASAPAEEFALVIESYRLVSPEMALPLAVLLPWAELVVGFSLLSGFLTRRAAVAAAALNAVFILAIASTKLRGIELPHCGCFGGGWHPRPSVTMAVDVVLLILALLAYRFGRSRWSLDNWADAGYT